MVSLFWGVNGRSIRPFIRFDNTGVQSYNYPAMMRGFNKNPRTRLLPLFLVIILCIVLAFPLAAGCGGKTSNTFIELLSLLPVDYATRSSGNYPEHFTLIDHAYINQAEGITVADLDELLNNIEQGELSYVPSGFVRGSFITGHGRFALESTIRKEYVGYDITCIDAEIQFGYTPAEGVAAIGRFDPQATKDALSNQDEWPSWAVDAYTTEDYHGVTIHSWGDGLKIHIQTSLMPPHIDHLGRAIPLAVTDKYLFYAPSVETVKLMIDASQNQYSSLADLPEYASIANGLADLNTYEAVIGSSSLSNFDSEQNEGETGGPLLKKYLTCGTGLAQDESGYYIAVALYHENAADAQANISLLRERTEYFMLLITNSPLESLVTDMQIGVEGNLLLAKIYTVSPSSLWDSWLYYPDPWLAHE